MKIENVSEREVVITSNVLLRYGVPAEDYKDLMAKVPDKVEFRYVNDVEAGSKSTCGPAFLVGLAVVPLLLRRRK
ncbi:CGP-CTERM sorting domain-containing protein [Thermococcus peptonophilus]